MPWAMLACYTCMSCHVMCYTRHATIIIAWFFRILRHVCVSNVALQKYNNKYLKGKHNNKGNHGNRN